MKCIGYIVEVGKLNGCKIVCLINVNKYVYK